MKVQRFDGNEARVISGVDADGAEGTNRDMIKSQYQAAVNRLLRRELIEDRDGRLFITIKGCEAIGLPPADWQLKRLEKKYICRTPEDDLSLLHSSDLVQRFESGWEGEDRLYLAKPGGELDEVHIWWSQRSVDPVDGDLFVGVVLWVGDDPNSLSEGVDPLDTLTARLRR